MATRAELEYEVGLLEREHKGLEKRYQKDVVLLKFPKGTPVMNEKGWVPRTLAQLRAARGA